MSKPTAIISPLQHRGATHIKVEIQNEAHAKKLINQIQERRWSATHRCWYVPKTDAFFQQLKELFKVKIKEDLSFQKEQNTDKKQFLKNTNLPIFEKAQPIIVRIEKENKTRVKAFVPYLKQDWIEKIKTIHGRAWNEEGKYWSLPMVKTTFWQMKEWFGKTLKIEFQLSANIPEKYVSRKWIDEKQTDYQSKPAKSNQPKIWEIVIPEQVIFQEIITNEGLKRMVVGERLIVRPDRVNLNLLAFCPYDKKNWVAFLKSIAGRKWSAPNKCWILPYVKETVELLQNYFGKLADMKFSIRTDLPAKWDNSEKRKIPTVNDKLNEFQKRALVAFEETLLLDRKAWRTIKKYKNELRALLLFYPRVKPSQISEYQIQQYLIYKIKEKQISRSTHNGIISALNIFYGKTLNQVEKVQSLQRPPKLNKLPNIISEQEMVRLIHAADNLKHKCMLVLIYSAGLRRSELLNLQVKDLNVERKVLFVRNGKGGTDRTSFYSDTAIGYVQEYLSIYKPTGFLFEGAHGERYSETSLQKVFTKAKLKSGVNPCLTIHGLRHSFATHLTERGVSLDVIRKLLGHKSVQSTEIYLHLAKDVMNKIKSPLENLDL